MVQSYFTDTFNYLIGFVFIFISYMPITLTAGPSCPSVIKSETTVTPFHIEQIRGVHSTRAANMNNKDNELVLKALNLLKEQQITNPNTPPQIIYGSQEGKPFLKPIKIKVPESVYPSIAGKLPFVEVQLTVRSGLDQLTYVTSDATMVREQIAQREKRIESLLRKKEQLNEEPEAFHQVISEIEKQINEESSLISINTEQLRKKLLIEKTFREDQVSFTSITANQFHILPKRLRVDITLVDRELVFDSLTPEQLNVLISDIPFIRAYNSVREIIEIAPQLNHITYDYRKSSFITSSQNINFELTGFNEVQAFVFIHTLYEELKKLTN